MATILIVDDSAVDRQLATQFLSADGAFTVEAVENGRLALDRLKQGGVDVVVTDLQMPEVNGLQLVTTIRVDYPRIPVILMTAQGTEVIAMDALEQGAASYVPKRKLKEWLSAAVNEVLALAETERAYQDLIACFNSTQFNLSLSNNADLIEPLIEYVQQILAGMNLCDDTEAYRIGVALREALLNAIYRGNLEISHDQMQQERERLIEGRPSLVEERTSQAPYRDRKIHIDVYVTPSEARFCIRDEGPGFDVASLPPPGGAAVLDETSHRGLILMRSFMDEIGFNETGNEVTLIKRAS